jgi:tetratricopeptide (TPR) repeat protein
VSALGKFQRYFATENRQALRSTFILLVLLVFVTIPVADAQDSQSHPSGLVTIQGTIFDSARKPIADASVLLKQKENARTFTAKSNSAGVFVFSALHSGTYVLSAEKPGFRNFVKDIPVLSDGEQKHIDLVLESSSTSSIEFSDQPDFMIAGVTDWTAVGGHGSDSSLRTSETLTRETLTLKPESPSPGEASTTSRTKESENKLHVVLESSPQSFDANHQLGEFYLHSGKYGESIPFLQAAYRINPEDHDNEHDLAVAYKQAGEFAQAREHVERLLAHQNRADLHRLLGELNEDLRDPLSAVREYEQAARMDPSEQNYFAWGSELLLHRAVWQAQEIFRKGTERYPQSARMLTALGTALFAGGLYEQAALKLCNASDLNPADTTPYLFLGKIEEASPTPLACVESRLKRFVQTQPENALANYFYAMAIWKRRKQEENQQTAQQSEALLTKAVTIDPKCSEAWLQLGILSSAQGDMQKAIVFYLKAIDANAQLSEAHYRLGVAYDRIGNSVQAKQEFQLHEELDAQQAAEREQERREVKQFQVVLENKLANPPVQ